MSILEWIGYSLLAVFGLLFGWYLPWMFQELFTAIWGPTMPQLATDFLQLFRFFPFTTPLLAILGFSLAIFVAKMMHQQGAKKIAVPDDDPRIIRSL